MTQNLVGPRLRHGRRSSSCSGPTHSNRVNCSHLKAVRDPIVEGPLPHARVPLQSVHVDQHFRVAAQESEIGAGKNAAAVPNLVLLGRFGQGAVGANGLQQIQFLRRFAPLGPRLIPLGALVARDRLDALDRSLLE